MGSPAGQGVLLLKGPALLLAFKEGPALLPLSGGLLHVLQAVHDPLRADLGVLSGVQGLQRQGRTVGHHQLRALRDQDVLGGELQPLGEHPDQGGVEGEGPPSKATGFLISRPWARPPMVCLAMAWKADRARFSLDTPWFSRGLDVSLGVHAAPAGHVIDAVPPGRQSVKLLDRNVQNGRHLVDKGARSARTAAVHAHIGNFQLSGCLIDAEEDNFCVLSSQFNGGAHAVILAAQRNGVGNHLLNIGEAQGVRQTLGSGAGQRQMDLGLRLALTQRPQRVGYTLDLVGWCRW